MSTSKDVYIKAHSKSYPLVMLLTIILGPLGLFYISWVGALILCGVAFVTAASIVGSVICWMLSVFIGLVSVRSHNRKVWATANLERSV